MHFYLILFLSTVVPTLPQTPSTITDPTEITSQEGETEEPTEAVPTPTILQALVNWDNETVKKTLEEFPDTAREKTSEKIKLPSNEPKNLRYLAERDTGLTPLHFAAARGDTEIAQLIISKGGKKHLQTDRYKSTPEDLALENNKFETARLIMNATPSAANFHIIVSLKNQTLVVYKDNTPILQENISSGKKSKPSEKGQFLIAQKSKDHRSNLHNNAPMPWFNRLSWTASGIHQGNLPGFPASHGCIRTTAKAAKFIYKTCPIGTLVIVE